MHLLSYALKNDVECVKWGEGVAAAFPGGSLSLHQFEMSPPSGLVLDSCQGLSIVGTGPALHGPG